MSIFSLTAGASISLSSEKAARDSFAFRGDQKLYRSQRQRPNLNRLSRLRVGQIQRSARTQGQGYATVSGLSQSLARALERFLTRERSETGPNPTAESTLRDRHHVETYLSCPLYKGGV
jgi:hypothetical protein